MQEGEKQLGISFLKKLLTQIEFIACINQLEGRFLSNEDKSLLTTIIDSLSQGKRIMLKKVNLITKKEESKP